jgi:hypothetical protein
MEQYKFENWLNGDVTLIYSEVFFDEKDDNGEIVEPICVDWGNFAESDVIKIKQMQKQIFDENININLEKFKSEFLKRYTKSLMPEEFLESEKQECFDILFSKIPIKQFITTKHWEITFYYNDLLEIQKYAKNTILKGIEVCLDFVHSPKNKYQIKNKVPSQVYAHVLYNYFHWLNNEFSSSDKTETNDNLNQNIEKIEFNNLYPSIFKNGSAYQMFIELNKMTVKESTKLADYSFIFHSMIKKSLIIKDTKHKTFIEFLNNKFDADISVLRFPFKNQLSKQPIFSTLLDKYKP